MSILSQIGIVVLIGCIIIILIRSNKTLKEASEEGEHFVDEWALRQQKKEEQALEKEERRQEKEERLREKKERKRNKKELLYEEEDSREENAWDQEQEDEWNQGGTWNREEDGWNQRDTRNQEEDSWNRKEDGWNQGDTRNQGDTWNREQDWDVDDDGDQEDRRSREKIISMDQYRNTGIILVQMDERHRPVARIRVTKLPFTIGRSEENMLVLDDLCVARKHCRIVERNGAFVLEDVGTANKIFAGGAVTDHVVLADQSTFYIGNVEFRVEMGMSRSGNTHLYQGAGERYYE